LFVVYYLQKRALGGETADFEGPAAINKLPQGCALLASGEWDGAGMLGRSCPNADMKRRQFIKFIGSAAAMCPLPLPMAWRFAASAQDSAGAVQSGVRQVAQPGQTSEIGQVATLQGEASVTRGNAAVALKINDSIFKNDTLSTGGDSALGITFDDQTTFSLSANTRIVINEFVYEENGLSNAASIAVGLGTAAFVASLVAKTGTMKIATPVATLGIRGTTGVVDVPQGTAAAGTEQPRIKLYPDTDGHVGQIDVFNLQGGRLGTLNLGASAFALRAGAGGRLEAVPFQIPPQEAARDRGVLQRLFAAHNIGRRMTQERLRARRFNRQRFNRNPRGGEQRPPGRGSIRRGRR
jgi:FecR protein